MYTPGAYFVEWAQKKISTVHDSYLKQKTARSKIPINFIINWARKKPFYYGRYAFFVVSFTTRTRWKWDESCEIQVVFGLVFKDGSAVWMGTAIVPVRIPCRPKSWLSIFSCVSIWQFSEKMTLFLNWERDFLLSGFCATSLQIQVFWVFSILSKFRFAAKKLDFCLLIIT